MYLVEEKSAVKYPLLMHHVCGNASISQSLIPLLPAVIELYIQCLIQCSLNIGEKTFSARDHLVEKMACATPDPNSFSN